MRIALIALSLLLVSATAVSAQTVRDLAGAYALVRVEALNDQGDWVTNTSTFGENPVGTIMYDGRGSMGVHIVRSDRSREADAPRGEGYFAYYGRYSVDASARTVTHHLEGHVDQRQVGQDFVRGFEIDGEYLTLTVVPQRRLRLVWERRR